MYPLILYRRGKKNLASKKKDPLYNYEKIDKDKLKETLTKEQWMATQEDWTEFPFTGEYESYDEDGIYVDVTTGQPLFSSDAKFNHGCGWPSFGKPIKPDLLIEKKDFSIGVPRTEVRSALGDAHLGHVFNDGPEEYGGLRYCINSASLHFVPKDKMEEEGYGYLLEVKD